MAFYLRSYKVLSEMLLMIAELDYRSYLLEKHLRRASFWTLDSRNQKLPFEHFIES